MTKLPEEWRNRWRGQGHLIVPKFYLLNKNLQYEARLDIIKNSFKVVFVRHPFVRIVSAYKDKVVDHNYAHWRQKSWTFTNQVTKINLKKTLVK